MITNIYCEVKYSLLRYLFVAVLHVITHAQQTSLRLYGPYRKTFLIL